MVFRPRSKDNTMAKTKEKESLSGYFRRQFEAHHDWLEAGTNADVIEQWKQDNSGQNYTKKIGQTLANIKSQMRKKYGLIKRRRRRRGRPVEAGAEAAVKRPRTPVAVLERLEGLIDECLSYARSQTLEGFDEVINHLRRARNGVVWKLGQPNSM
jgi:hypothetical protein